MPAIAHYPRLAAGCVGVCHISQFDQIGIHIKRRGHADNLAAVMGAKFLRVYAIISAGPQWVFFDLGKTLTNEVLIFAAMTASSFSSVLMSVTVGRLPLKDATLVPLRDLIIASCVDMAAWLLMPVG